MDDVASSTEWETEWLSLDRDQLIEFIRSSDLTVKDEWDLWQVYRMLLLYYTSRYGMNAVMSSSSLIVYWHTFRIKAVFSDLGSLEPYVIKTYIESEYKQIPEIEFYTSPYNSFICWSAPV